MKIRGVEIKIIRGDIAEIKVDAVVVQSYGRDMSAPKADSFKARNLIHAVVAEDGIPIDDKKVRYACAHALAVARSLKVRSIALPAIGYADAGLTLTASAKIMSQEIFRHIREEKHFLKEIDLVLRNDEDFKAFRRTAESYLNHIVGSLCQGPFVTVDTIIEVEGGVVLIKRSNPPFGWAIPGGFLDYGESLEEAAAREAKEETGLVVTNLRQFHTYSNPERDPRFHTISTVFICQAKGKPEAASDAAVARIVGLGAWRDMEIAFDHKRVLEDYSRTR